MEFGAGAPSSAAVDDLSHQFNSRSRSCSGIERRFADTLPPLSDVAELAVYRIAQESLTNVARHAHASRVDVTLEAGPGSVVLRVVDDGRGIDETAR